MLLSSTIVDEELYESIISRGYSKKGFIGEIKTTDEEDIFFKLLITKLRESKLNPNLLNIEPLADKTLNVFYGTYYIGKINLRNKNYYMQVLRGMYDVKEYEDITIKECIDNIPAWIRRVKYCLRG